VSTISPIVSEVVRYMVTDGRNFEARMLPVNGPTSEVERQLAWARDVDQRDGWYLVHGSVEFGTRQNGTFQVEHRRSVPLFVNGFRRMSNFLRA
jgi:hypothetical protein